MMKPVLTAVLLFMTLFLGVRNDCVALLRADTGETVAVYPMKVQMLPRYDQLALEAGIPIYSRDQLTHLLEDFLS